MTRELSALRPAGLQLLIAGLFLVLMLLVGSTGAAKLLLPSPENTAGELLRALAAHREPAAHRELSQGLKEQVPPEQLESLATAIEQRLGGVSQVSVQTVDERESRATVRATLRVGAGEERDVELPLVKEEGFWRVASIESLRALAR